MLLHNINARIGLCNGTRLRITRLGRLILEGAILGGQFDGQIRVIPRLKLSTSPIDDYPFILTRKQYPVRLCFAMTANKSQGQFLQHVGVDIRNQAFVHGQFFVAISRALDIRKLTLLFEKDSECMVENVVWPEILLKE